MFNQFNHHKRWIERINLRFDYWLYAFATYVLPIVIALLSLMALFFWEAEYTNLSPRKVNFQVFEQDSRSLSPNEALNELTRREASPLPRYKAF